MLEFCLDIVPKLNFLIKLLSIQMFVLRRFKANVYTENICIGAYTQQAKPFQQTINDINVTSSQKLPFLIKQNFVSV